MKEQIRILQVEDSAADAELMARALRKAGYDVAWTRVAREADFIRALEPAPDVVLADYRLPGFSGLRALELLKRRHPEIPLIIVSGTIGEEKAVETIRLGADDYVWKDRLGRLPTAVRNAVLAARERAAGRKTQSELDALGERLKSVVTALPDVVWSIAVPSREVLYISPAASAVFGREPRDFYQDRDTWISLVHPEDRPRVVAALETPLPREYQSEYRIVTPSGEVRWIQGRGRFVTDASGKAGRADGISRDVTELVRLSEALREREAGLRHAQVMAKLAHVVTGDDGAFGTWSETLPQLAGVAPEELPRSTRDWLELVHAADRARFRATSLEAGRTRRRAEVEYRLHHATRGVIHVRQTMEPLAPATEGPLRWFNTLQDITESKLAEERIQRLNRVYAVLSGINGAIVRIREQRQLFDEACRVAVEAGRFVMAWIGLVDDEAALVRPVAAHGEQVQAFLANAPLAVLESKPGGRGLAGRAIRTKSVIVSSDVKHDPQHLMRKELDERGINSLAILPLLVDGEALGVLALYAADVGFFDEEELRLLRELAGDVAFALDHIRKAQKLDYLSYYDPLSGLPNRTLFHERLKLQLEEAARKGERVALQILDVERFKSVNDTLGRQAGDGVLVDLARRIQQGALPTSWFARLEADHFAIVMPGVSAGEQVARRTEQRMTEVFGVPFEIGEAKLRLAARVGIALFPDDATDAEALLRNAEAALKKAKAIGERYLFYTQEMTARIAEKLALENRLRQALEKDEFVLHYQPKVDIEARTVMGMEALIRWQSPELGLVPPLQFIPLLEETGLILPVGAWALRRAALDHRAWVEAGLKPPRVAVNVSAIQLRQRDFVEAVERSAADGVSPPAIELELTESLVMEDIEASIDKLTALRRLGIGIAIDDFGTGYSSLFYLARLPVEALKIDRSFVATMVQDPSTMTLVETMISLAHSLRLKVIAEGVETEEQATILRRLRCDQMQGYLFSRPIAREQMAALLASGSGLSRPA
ncbi:MAG: EAL domain-containing protein [Betaproteobacteria bacterium]|nr:MAG: EAL domain-containing protein [Betaproteobacteria bacterium]